MKGIDKLDLKWQIHIENTYYETGDFEQALVDKRRRYGIYRGLKPQLISKLLA